MTTPDGCPASSMQPWEIVAYCAVQVGAYTHETESLQR
jgi:hypothetical protein